MSGGVKEVFLVFLLPFWSLFLPFMLKPALNQGVGFSRPSPVSLLGFALPAPGMRKYHPFHCWPHPRGWAGGIHRFVQNGAERHAS